jgi:DNA-binding Lrp family transcriptional regulator
MTEPQSRNSSGGQTGPRRSASGDRTSRPDKLVLKDRDRGSGTAEPRPIDDIDDRIITLLTGDARLSARAIARELGMSPGAISDRILRLETGGVITGYHASVDIIAVGYQLRAIIGMRIDRAGESLEGVIDQLMAIRNVQTVKLVTGSWDLLVEIVARDNAELREILTDTISHVPGVTTTETMVNLQTRQRPGSWSPI